LKLVIIRFGTRCENSSDECDPDFAESHQQAMIFFGQMPN